MTKFLVFFGFLFSFIFSTQAALEGKYFDCIFESDDNVVFPARTVCYVAEAEDDVDGSNIVDIESIDGFRIKLTITTDGEIYGYWNGPNKEGHFHYNLGDLEREANCFYNDTNSLCLRDKDE